MYLKVLLHIFDRDIKKQLPGALSGEPLNIIYHTSIQENMNKTQTVTNPGTIISNTVSVLFGLLTLAIGIVNTFWGNDPGFGIFIILLSAAFFPPITALVKEKTGRQIPGYLKILLALFIFVGIARRWRAFRQDRNHDPGFESMVANEYCQVVVTNE